MGELTPSELTRLTVEQYFGLVEAGVLTEDDRVELLEGVIVAMRPTCCRIASARRGSTRPQGFPSTGSSIFATRSSRCIASRIHRPPATPPRALHVGAIGLELAALPGAGVTVADLLPGR